MPLLSSQTNETKLVGALVDVLLEIKALVQSARVALEAETSKQRPSR